MVGNMFFVTRLKCWYCKVNGKFTRLSPNEDDAKKAHAVLLAEHGCTKPTVTDAVVMYLKWVQENRADKTHGKYERTLNSFAAMYPTLLAADVRPKHADAWIKKHAEGCNATTVNDRMTTLQGCWSWLERQGHLKSELRTLNKPTPKARELFIESERWEELLKAAGPSVRPVIRFMLFSGCRPQEVVMLQAKHWTGTHFALPKSRAKGKRAGRAIRVPEWMVEEIGQLVAKRKKDEYVFQTNAGSPWTKDSMNCAFRRLRKKMGEPELCATTLRHSFAADKIRRGESIEIVAKLMGHSSTAMVFARYGHLASQVERLNATLNATPKIDLI